MAFWREVFGGRKSWAIASITFSFLGLATGVSNDNNHSKSERAYTQFLSLSYQKLRDKIVSSDLILKGSIKRLDTKGKDKVSVGEGMITERYHRIVVVDVYDVFKGKTDNNQINVKYDEMLVSVGSPELGPMELIEGMIVTLFLRKNGMDYELAWREYIPATNDLRAQSQGKGDVIEKLGVEYTKALDSRDPYLTKVAICILGVMGYKPAYDRMAELASSENEEVRGLALVSCIKFGEEMKVRDAIEYADNWDGKNRRIGPIVGEITVAIEQIGNRWEFVSQDTIDLLRTYPYRHEKVKMAAGVAIDLVEKYRKIGIEEFRKMREKMKVQGKIPGAPIKDEDCGANGNMGFRREAEAERKKSENGTSVEINTSNISRRYLATAIIIFIMIVFGCYLFRISRNNNKKQ